MLLFDKAEVIDAEAIATLINSAYRGESSRRGWTTEADLLHGLRTTPQAVAEIIRRQDAFMLIGVRNDEIVATLCAELQVLAGHNTAHFGMIAVKPGLQGRGYGKLLLQAAETITHRQWRVAGYHMAVISLRQELIAFYQRRGYLPTGEYRAFPAESDLWQPKVENMTLQYLAKLR
jgi:GNAT superfamily N-acetyltransferase